MHQGLTLDVPTCCSWNKAGKQFCYGDAAGDVSIIELFKNSSKCIRKAKERKKVKGIYCGSDDKIWYCDVDKLYYKYNRHPPEDKVFNLERLEKIYSKCSRSHHRLLRHDPAAGLRRGGPLPLLPLRRLQLHPDLARQG